MITIKYGFAIVAALLATYLVGSFIIGHFDWLFGEHINSFGTDDGPGRRFLFLWLGGGIAALACLFVGRPTE